MGFLDKLFGKSSTEQPIVIVSGLPRSGTSMMMKMLDAGGIPPLTDNIRTADDDNPKGYYEFERAKKLKEGDEAWLLEAEGKAVKVISALLPHLPDNYDYKVIFMRRAMPEILASQRKMLINRGEDPDKVSDEEIAALYQKHMDNVFEFIDEHENVQRLDVDYNSIIKDPLPFVEQVVSFLGQDLDQDAMTAVVDPNLYRQRV
jgi:LPS sulfotransferase NodH